MRRADCSRSLHGWQSLLLAATLLTLTRTRITLGENPKFAAGAHWFRSMFRCAAPILILVLIPRMPGALPG